jgi:hypothetical protein
MEEQKKLRDMNESDYQLTFISPGTGQRKSAGGFFLYATSSGTENS